MNRCPYCKRFIKITEVWTNWNDELTKVKGTCKRCGEVDVEYDCYEDVMGWGD